MAIEKNTTAIKKPRKTIEDEREPIHNPTVPLYTRKPRNYAPLLIGALMMAVFLLGMAFMKIQYLEKGIAQNTTPPTDSQPTNPPAVKDVKPGHLSHIGKEDAKVSIIEFSDFQCPFCKAFFTDAYKQIKSEYIDTGKVKLYFRHYPLSFHPNAQKASESSECANEQGKFWEYHDLLFTNQEKWSELAADEVINSFSSYATELNLDTNSFTSCVTSGKYADKVKEDLDAGTKTGVSGTPTFYINGKELVGALPFASFKTIIDEELKKIK